MNHPSQRVIVAIDGPAGSGKSTTARRIAERLGWLYLDTGAMYRAAALAVLRAGSPLSEQAAAEVMENAALDFRVETAGTRVLLDGEDVTEKIRSAEVSEASSRVSSYRPVRERMVELQRRIAGRLDDRGVILEGRDIGTVVFPDADLKIFLVASIDERARRRHAELQQAGDDVPALEEVRRDIAERDARDSQRDLAPMRPAPDAVTLDTTELSFDEQVERILGLLKERQREHAPG